MTARRLIPLFAVPALALAGAAAAATAPRLLASARITAGPVLAGKRVYWAEGAGRTAWS